MKRTLFVFLFLLILSALSADEGQTLVVRQRDGGSTVFLLNERPRIVFSDELVIVSSSSLTVSFPYSLVSGFYYEGVADGVVPVRDEPSFARSGDCLTFSSLPAGSAVRLYSLDGRMVGSCRADTQGCASLSLDGMPSGAYVVSVGGKTFKILNR